MNLELGDGRRCGAPLWTCGRKTDVARTIEAAKRATVTIDTSKPTSTVTKNVPSRGARRRPLLFKVTDPAPSCGWAAVTITIKLKSKTVRTITVPNIATNKAHSCAFKVSLKKGSYTWTAKATDVAGNAGKASAAKKLIVK
jgi:hypothetical protein